MRTFAYCAESFFDVTRRAAGVNPLTCPPLTAEDFNPAWLNQFDLLYFDLHGELGQNYWTGDRGILALWDWPGSWLTSVSR